MITAIFSVGLILITARSVSASRATMLATYFLFVGRGDLDFANAVDHVIIGEDIAARVDHDAGAHAVDAAGASLTAACGAGRTVFSPRMLTTDGLAFWAALTIGVNRWSDAVASPERMKKIPAQANMAERHPAGP